MMRRLLIGCAIMMLMGACRSSSPVVYVTNPATVARTEMAEVQARYIKGFSDGFVVTDAAGVEVPYQILTNGNVIFPVTLDAGATATFSIKPGTPTPVKPKVFGRKFPEHKDNMNWENDKSAYVAYGPALQASGERGFGYDVWTKSVDTLVIEMRNELRDRKISLHKDHGNGMDAYTVANTLGAGTAALLDDNGDIIYPWAWRDYQVLENGPLRFAVRLVYNPADIAGDKDVVETRLITLDAGSNLNRTQVSYDGLTKARTVAPGIVIHEQNPDGYLYDATRGVMAYADSTDNARNNNGVIYIGVVTPGGKIRSVDYKPVQEPAKQALGHILAKTDYNPGDVFDYYWGSAWSKNPTGPKKPEEWFKQLADFAECVNNPLVIKVKR